MGVERTPAGRKRKREYEQRQEKRWAKRNGPVTVRFVDPATLRPDAAAAPAELGELGDQVVDDGAELLEEQP